MFLFISKFEHTRSEHSPDVSVPFVEPLLHYGVYEGRAVEEHALVALVVVLLRDLRFFQI